MSDFEDPGAPNREENLSGTIMYHHANFHADRCHHCQDICNWTQKKTESNIPFHTVLHAVWQVTSI